MLRSINFLCLLLAVAWLARAPDWEPAIVALGFLGTLGLQEYFLGLRFLDRAQVDARLGAMEARLAAAKASVYVSGNDCKFLVESCSASVDRLLARGVRLHVLLLSPTDALSEMLSLIDPRFNSASEFQTSMHEVLKRLKDWKQRYPSQFEYRLLPFLPALGFFIVDPESFRGTLKIEVYTAKHWKPIESRPHLLLSRLNSKWREYFLTQWHNYWAAATEA
ncbi:MAG: hypothetical protein K5880_11725 [Hydrogenophaga sp.]|uniref:hypothetical protein n=1 Tax=Hydrogenophaga sp. TaxID=1904254 RepID=UPI002610A49B|nr:hypothetical protein [Hydrogenophaga sp.]MCV0439294.1 hypothetical protein [Hydrogenophaga sp.]